MAAKKLICPRKKIELEQTLNSIKGSVSRLNSEYAVAEVKAIIREVEPQFLMEEFSDLIDFEDFEFSH